MGKFSYYDEVEFHYIVEGELLISPNTAVFPLHLTIQAKTNDAAISTAETFFEEMKAEAKNLDESIALELENYTQQHKTRIMSKTFSKKDSDYFEVNFYFSLHLTFSDDSFWNRTRKVAQVFNFLRKYESKESENATFSHSQPEYRISNKEEYRSQIVEIAYDKFMSMAQVIGNKEKKTPVIKKMNFPQEINCSVSNIMKATLGLKCNFEFQFVENDS